MTGRTLADRCTIVIATRNRGTTLLATLARLRSLPEQPPIIVVDNGSADATVADVRRRHPEVQIIALGENRGAVARTVGAAAAHTPYVAFNDDDTWWQPGSLDRACELLDRHPEVALLTARVTVEPTGRVDPTCLAMATSPVRKRSAAPGTAILGFLAGASVARRDAFLAVGGYHPRIFFGGEEALVAYDLVSAGWELLYCDELRAVHAPASAERDPRGRRRLIVRNRLWTTWLRRPLTGALTETASEVAASLRSGDRAALAGLLEALRGLAWVRRERRTVPGEVEREILRLRRHTALQAESGATARGATPRSRAAG